METELTQRPHTGLAGVGPEKRFFPSPLLLHAPLALYLPGEVPALNHGSLGSFVPHGLAPACVEPVLRHECTEVG